MRHVVLKVQVKQVSHVCFIALPVLWNAEDFASFQCIFPNSVRPPKLARCTHKVLLCTHWVGGMFSSPQFCQKIDVLLHQPSSLGWSCRTEARQSVLVTSDRIQPLHQVHWREIGIICGPWVRLSYFPGPALSFAGKEGIDITPREGMKH